MTCPVCQAENRPERRFCHACAAPLAATACPGCGFVNFPGERYCGGCALEVAAAPVTSAPMREPPAPAPAAERRQVTVMFCDMVGSTALSAELDAEDLRDLITRFQGACAAEVTRFDGFVARYMGDGMLVYFGYPRAHEDSAERAVRAGLAIVDAVGALGSQPVQPHVRVGIATGLVVVGDIIGEGASEERAVVGETPNLAARLQALAEPDTVVISSRTRRLVRDVFEVEDLGAHPLKGFPEPVQAWRAVCQARPSRGVPRAPEGGVVPLFGRAFELALMKERWGAAGRGEGGVVALAGDAGSGKSRLVEGFVEAIRGGPHPPFDVVRYACARHHASTSLYPVVEQVSRAAGIDLTDPVEVRREKLGTFVQGWSTDVARDLAATGMVLSFDQGEEGASPEERRREMLASLCRYVVARGNGEPVLVVFEDVQWADPTTLELLQGLIGRIGSGPVMLVISHRPDFEPPWRGAAGLTSLSLGRMRPDAARELVLAVAGETRLAGSVVDAILERGDGVPGFIVEVTRAVGAKGDAGRSTDPLERARVPETLHDSLAAQLDRLGPARVVAQTAAVIGRDFSRDLLARVVGMPPEVLSSHLEALVEGGLLVETDPTGASFAFRQALLGDLAYESLLRSDRRRIHGRIATVLLDELPTAAEADPSSTARHLSGADRQREASDWWARAAERAANQAAFPEAVAHLRCAVAARTPLVDAADPADCQAVAELQIELALKLRLVGGSEEAFPFLDQAEALIAPHDLPATLSHVCFTRGNLFFNLGDVARCAASHERALELAERSGSALARARALGGLADVQMLVGDVVTAAELVERCVAVALEHGFDAIAAANAAAGAFAYHSAARSEDALRMVRIVTERAEAAGVPRALMVAHTAMALIAAGRQDLDEAERALARRDALMTEAMLLSDAWYVDYRVFRLRGQWKEGHAFVAEKLERAARSGRGASGAWYAVNRTCLLAEAPAETLDADLAEIYEALDGAPPNLSKWVAMSMVEGLIHRGAWRQLADTVARFAPMWEPSHSPRVALWLDAARAALAWAADPEDPGTGREVRRLIEEARARDVAGVELTLQEMIGPAHAEGRVNRALA